MMQIIRSKKIFLFISLIAVLGAILSIIFFGFNLGVDFRGGSLWQLSFDNVEEATLKEFMEVELGTKVSSISYDETQNTYSILLPFIDTETKIDYFNRLTDEFGQVEEIDFWLASPSISDELKRMAMWAIGLVLLFISLYVTLVFRSASGPIRSYKYGIITLITLAHDVLIAAGFLAILGYFREITIDTNFVVALLMIMGFSVHDTIVIFDRIRENTYGFKLGEDLGGVVNRSINEVFKRSLNTSLTLMLVLLAIFFFGPGLIKYFVLTIFIGTFVGTYSSLFVASPLLVFWHEISAALSRKSR